MKPYSQAYFKLYLIAAVFLLMPLFGLKVSLASTCPTNIILPGPKDSIANASGCNIQDGQITLDLSNYGGAPPFQLTLNGQTNTSGVFQGLGPGRYKLRVIDANGCKDSSNNYLITFPGGLQSPSMPTPEVASSCNGLGKINVTNLIGAGPFDIYLTSIGDSAVNKASGFTFQNVPIGSHNILVKDNNGCEFKFDGIYVRNKAPEIVFAEGCSAGYDAIIFVGESAYINGVSPGILKWEPRSFLKYLSDTTIANPTATPPAGIYNYILHSTDYSNCKECIDTVQIIVLPELSIPNTFTPNGDSYNDVWVIGDITRFQDNCEVWIYNRWGERVFHQTGYRNGEEWDGTNNGMALPPATYYYVIDIKAKDSAGKVKKYAGSITIIK